jgi:hypothetical protein
MGTSNPGSIQWGNVTRNQDLLNFTVQKASWAAGQRLRLFFKNAARALAIRDAQVRVLPPGLRVSVNSDSEMHFFAKIRFQLSL